ncbi:uncharacterized protein LOC135169893 [Diachasmimorpha longicaudata]|uniref:uncharacterized protein LOC135169893 n=1 Tax=Diachasmimorpha longicaudata TaxID=58733 RepID=UPI0030B89C1D
MGYWRLSPRLRCFAPSPSIVTPKIFSIKPSPPLTASPGVVSAPLNISNFTQAFTNPVPIPIGFQRHWHKPSPKVHSYPRVSDRLRILAFRKLRLQLHSTSASSHHPFMSISISTTFQFWY